MSEPSGSVGTATEVRAEPTAPPRSWLARHADELTWAGGLFAVLVLLGVPLGLLWDALSPGQGFGILLRQGIEASESGAAIEAEGRFAVIVLVVGVVAGTVAWLLRRARGVLLTVALAGGTLLNSYVIELTGHLARGTEPLQHHNGYTFYAHLPLEIHMTGLLVLESVVALLIYGGCVAFAARDDLGRPE